MSILYSDAKFCSRQDSLSASTFSDPSGFCGSVATVRQLCREYLSNPTAETLRRLVQAYYDAGFLPLPIVWQTKKPAVAEWTTLKTQRLPFHELWDEFWVPAIEKHGLPLSIATILGRVSKFVAIDVDAPAQFCQWLDEVERECPQLYELLLKKFPRQRSHTISEDDFKDKAKAKISAENIGLRRGAIFLPYETLPYNDGKEITRLDFPAFGFEFRSCDSYQLLPPSLHPSGEHYQWKVAPDEVSENVLLTQDLAFEILHWRDRHAESDETTVILSGNALDDETVSKIAAVWAPYWIAGYRHYLALALAGLCAWRGIPKDDCVRIVKLIVDLTHDEELSERLYQVAYTYSRAAQGDKKVAGVGILRTFLAENDEDKGDGEGDGRKPLLNEDDVRKLSKSIPTLVRRTRQTGRE